MCGERVELSVAGLEIGEHLVGVCVAEIFGFCGGPGQEVAEGGAVE